MQQRFVELYVQLNNASEAARQAGASARSASVTSTRWLANASIRAKIAELQEDISLQTGVNTLWIVKNLKEVVERCLQKKPVMVFDPVEKAMVQKTDEETGEGVWEFDSNGANKALQLLGMNQGTFERDNEQKKGTIIVEVQD